MLAAFGKAIIVQIASVPVQNRQKWEACNVLLRDPFAF